MLACCINLNRCITNALSPTVLTVPCGSPSCLNPTKQHLPGAFEAMIFSLQKLRRIVSGRCHCGPSYKFGSNNTSSLAIAFYFTLAIICTCSRHSHAVAPQTQLTNSLANNSRECEFVQRTINAVSITTTG